MLSKKWNASFVALYCALGLSFFFGVGYERAVATIMPYPAKIEKLTEQSDVVLKVKVLSVEPFQPEPLKPEPSSRVVLKSAFWKIFRAKVKVISTLKGTSVPEVCEFIFRSDQPASDTPKMWIDCGPDNDAHFKLEPQKCYILFGKKVNGQSLFVQFVQAAQNVTMRSWEGFFRAADDKPISSGVTVDQAIWNELMDQLYSKNAATSAYGAQTLFALSDNSSSVYYASNDFSRRKILDLLFASKLPHVVALNSDKFLADLIQSVGESSPYSDESRRMRFLWSRADSPMCSWSEFCTTDNTAVAPAVPFLIAVANGKYDSKVRAKAILALGLCQKQPKLAAAIVANLPGWLISADPEIRAAGVLLSTDYSAKISPSDLTKLFHDPDSHVRQAAALSAAMAKNESSIPQLDKLLGDSNPKVRGSAALALVAFPVPKVLKILRSNLSNSDFGVGFLCRIAFFDPASVKEQLLAQCQKITTPISGVPSTDAQMLFQNGLATSPHSLAQRALLDYLDRQSSASLSKSEFVSYLNCMEQFAHSDAAMTGRAYEILITHRLNERADLFKKHAIAAQPGLPLIAFDQPDMLLKNGALKYK